MPLETVAVRLGFRNIQHEIVVVSGKPSYDSEPAAVFASRGNLDGPVAQLARGLNTGAAGTRTGLTIPLFAVQVKDRAERLRLAVAFDLVPCEGLAFAVRLNSNRNGPWAGISNELGAGGIHLPRPERILCPAPRAEQKHQCSEENISHAETMLDSQEARQVEAGTKGV